MGGAAPNAELLAGRGLGLVGLAGARCGEAGTSKANSAGVTHLGKGGGPSPKLHLSDKALAAPLSSAGVVLPVPGHRLQRGRQAEAGDALHLLRDHVLGDAILPRKPCHGKRL